MGIVSIVKKIVSKGDSKDDKRKGENNDIKEYFVDDMSQFLMDWGFDTKESVKIAEEFYERHKNKIKEIL